MKKGETWQSRLMWWCGTLLAIVALGVFGVSFFLPAVQNGGWLGGPLQPLTGWEAFLDSLESPFTQSAFFLDPLVWSCLLSPVLNLLMLLALPACLPAYLLLRQYAGVYGGCLLLGASAALWVCLEVYDTFDIGFFLWIGAVFAMGFASLPISTSHILQERSRYEKILAELKTAHEDQ